MESPLCSNSFPLLLVLGWGLVENSLAHLSLHPLLHLSWSPRLPSIFTSSAIPLSFLSMRSIRGPLLSVKMLSLMLSPILVWYAVFAPHYPFLGRAPYFFQLFSKIKVSFLSSPSHPALPKKSVSFLCNHWSHTPTFPWCQHMQLHQHLLSDHIFFHVLHAFVCRHLREAPWHDDFPELICGFLMLHSTYFSRNLEPQEDGNWSSGTSKVRY